MVGFGMTDVDPERAKNETPKYLFKILLIGDGGTGKSAALAKFSSNRFNPIYVMTPGIDFAIKVLQIGGEIAKIQIWDTPGQEQFRTITYSYYRGVQGAMIFFDLTDQSSFHNVEGWFEEIGHFTPEDLPIIIVGTRSDFVDQRSVSTEDIQKVAKELNVDFFEISCKTGENVNARFESLVHKMILAKKRNYESGHSMAKPLVVKNKGDKTQSKTCTIL